MLPPHPSYSADYLQHCLFSLDLWSDTFKIKQFINFGRNGIMFFRVSKPDTISMSDTWIFDDSSDSEVLSADYNTFRIAMRS